MRYFPAPSVTDEGPKGEAELEVWESLKAAFEADEEGVLYHRYPIFDRGGHRFEEEPNFVLLHRELGLVVVECVHYTFEKIDTIERGTWQLQWADEEEVEPHDLARDKCIFLQQLFTRERALRSGTGCKVPTSVFIVLPNITEQEWNFREFDTEIESTDVIFKDDLTPKSLRETLESGTDGSTLDEREFGAAIDVLSGGQPISGAHGRPVDDPTTKRDYYDRVEKGLRGLDEQQQKIGMRVPPGPQQIRGIAGSGKTVLLAMKAARIAADPKYDDWNIALTFRTKTISEHVTNLVARFYEQFAHDSFDETSTNLEILHGWGGVTTGPGIYYRIANQIDGHRPKTYGEARELYDEEPDLLEALSLELLATGDIPTLWDAILVDEAQDFGEYFFKMCLEALDENDRLIWGYDEAQDLGNLTAPSPKQVFGSDKDGEPVVDMRGSYESGVQKSHIMRESYRAPREVLMIAHALGMGLKRQQGPVQTITRADGWEKIGYEVEGDFRKIGSEVTISRPPEHSPHPLQDERDASPFVEIEWLPDRLREIEWVSNRIEEDVRHEGLDPEQIMAILLGDVKHRFGTRMLDELESREIDANRVWEGSARQFSVEGEVTLTTVRKAKGNEAAAVYVVGLDQVANHNFIKSEVRRRNNLFVALTRTRAWSTLTGVKTPALIEEFNDVTEEVRSSTPSLTFEVPDPAALTNQLEADTEDLEITTLSDFTTE